MRLLRKLRRFAISVTAVLLGAGVLGAAAAVVPTPALAATGCSVAYTVPSQWNTGFTANIVITNLGSPLTSWNLGYSYSGNQTLQSGWNGTWTQSGANVTVANASWNGSVATNGTVTIGANFNYSGTNTSPTTFTLNGVTCTGSVTGSIVASPATLSVKQGSTGTFGLSLSAAPSANVTVTTTRTSGDSGLTVTGGGTLTFTPSNYATAQTVTVSADSSSTGSATFTAAATGYPSAAITVAETSSGSGGGGPAPQLHVSGNKLLNASGGQVILRGVDRSGTEYACVQGNGIFDGEVDQAAVTAMLSWKVNAVRVPLNEACWNAESYVTAADAGTNYINAIKSYVSLLNSNGLVAILDLHWTDGTYTGPSAGCSSAQATCQKPMPDAAQAIPFWTSVANTFKSNDAVIFDLFNEPYPDGNQDTAAAWACLKNGGTCPGVSFPVAGMQTLVNAVRATGSTNIVMVPGVQYANVLDQWLANKPTDSSGNLVASWHSYASQICNKQSCWDSMVKPVLQSAPVIAGEIGEADCADTYVTPLMTYLDTNGGNYLAWAWDTYSCSGFPSLISDYNGTPTAFGLGYRNHLLILDGQTPPSGP